MTREPSQPASPGSGDSSLEEEPDVQLEAHTKDAPKTKVIKNSSKGVHTK